MFVLQIQPEDCSLLGKKIFKYMEQRQLSVCRMARQVNITQPGLRAIALRGGNPKKVNIDKLALVMETSPLELYQLVFIDKLKEITNTSEVLVEEFYQLVRIFQRYAATIPVEQRPSDYKLLTEAFKLVKSFR